MANPITTLYLESLGLDPKLIPLDSVERTGYCEYTLTEHGMKIWVEQAQAYAKTRHTWPDGFDYERLVHCWRADGHHWHNDVFID